ncbi:hypothetical protein GUI12_00130 [Anaplasmataceae bacterium AB001_6]|nr:hypothetical protein GUI12_00130 [Anaplasmataceae bacterium AB001_6]
MPNKSEVSNMPNENIKRTSADNNNNSLKIKKAVTAAIFAATIIGGALSLALGAPIVVSALLISIGATLTTLGIVSLVTSYITSTVTKVTDKISEDISEKAAKIMDDMAAPIQGVLDDIHTTANNAVAAQNAIGNAAAGAAEAVGAAGAAIGNAAAGAAGAVGAAGGTAPRLLAQGMQIAAGAAQNAYRGAANWIWGGNNNATTPNQPVVPHARGEDHHSADFPSLAPSQMEMLDDAMQSILPVNPQEGSSVDPPAAESARIESIRQQHNRTTPQNYGAEGNLNQGTQKFSLNLQENDRRNEETNAPGLMAMGMQAIGGMMQGAFNRLLEAGAAQYEPRSLSSLDMDGISFLSDANLLASIEREEEFVDALESLDSTSSLDSDFEAISLSEVNEISGRQQPINAPTTQEQRAELSDAMQEDSVDPAEVSSVEEEVFHSLEESVGRSSQISQGSGLDSDFEAISLSEINEISGRQQPINAPTTQEQRAELSSAMQEDSVDPAEGSSVDPREGSSVDQEEVFHSLEESVGESLYKSVSQDSGLNLDANDDHREPDNFLSIDTPQSKESLYRSVSQDSGLDVNANDDHERSDRQSLNSNHSARRESFHISRSRSRSQDFELDDENLGSSISIVSLSEINAISGRQEPVNAPTTQEQIAELSDAMKEDSSVDEEESRLFSNPGALEEVREARSQNGNRTHPPQI